MNKGGAVVAEADSARESVANIVPSDQDVSARVTAVFKLKK
jgi:hypothetical protein